MCGKELVPGHYEMDHVQALVHDGDNALANFRAICTSPCHKQKSLKDVQARAKRDRLAVGGKQRKGVPMAGSRASGWKKLINGQTVRRT